MSSYSSSDEYNSDEINELFNNPPRRHHTRVPPIVPQRARVTPIVPPVQHHAVPLIVPSVQHHQPAVPSIVPSQVRKSAGTTLSGEVLLQLAADPFTRTKDI